MMKRNPLLLTLPLLLLSCSTNSGIPVQSGGAIPFPEEGQTPDGPVAKLPKKTRTFYQLLVYSFADGNGDGIGDFKGIIDHLDYLQGLGVGGLWLSPVLDAYSYHAYDVLDYYKINPRYEVTVSGVKYDLSKLLEECHSRDMMVLMDLVLNHTHSDNVWRQEHPNWYRGPDAFGGTMKDLDYDNPQVRTAVKDVGKYWIGQGVDGFRLDAAKWIFNQGGVFDGADDEKNYAWWKEFYEACQTVNPNVYMVGEVLVENNIPEDRMYYQTMMDSNFNFEMRDHVIRALNGDAASYVDHIADFQSTIRGYNPKGIEASCLSNHDIGRFNQHYSLSAKKQALAGALNILAPGDSYVYYGEELGMTGTSDGWADMAYRTPMPFASGRTNPNDYLYASAPSRRMTTSTLTSKTADEDKASKSSLYQVFAKAIKTKNASMALYEGTVAWKEAQGALGSFCMQSGDDKETVFFNASDSAMKVTLSDAVILLGQTAYDGYCAYQDQTLYLAPYGVAVLGGSAKATKIDVDGTTSAGPQEITPDAKGTVVNEEKSGNLTLHFKSDRVSGTVNCYAWVGETRYLGDWPGSAMTLRDGWYTITLPHGASNVIFNAANWQTEDLHRNNPGEYWFVGDDGNSGNWYTQNPRP